MRGRHEEQEVMLAYVNLEERVPKDHPLRTIKAVADEALGRLSPELDFVVSRATGIRATTTGSVSGPCAIVE